jgi:hypothetical protein
MKYLILQSGKIKLATDRKDDCDRMFSEMNMLYPKERIEMFERIRVIKPEHPVRLITLHGGKMFTEKTA